MHSGPIRQEVELRGGEKLDKMREESICQAREVIDKEEIHTAKQNTWPWWYVV